MKNMPTNRHSTQGGFSLIELVFAMGIALVIAGMALPNFLTATHSARLKGSVNEFATLLQTERIKAIDDDLYYSAYVLGGNPQLGFVDIYPQSALGASGHGGTQVDPKDPQVAINAEILQRAVGAAPRTASLQALFLPPNAAVALYDGTVNPITFGPRGLPCSAPAGVCKTSVAAGDVAYWMFFQDNVTQNWGAVTVTPAGRVRRWLYQGGANGTWVAY